DDPAAGRQDPDRSGAGPVALVRGREIVGGYGPGARDGGGPRAAVAQRPCRRVTERRGEAGDGRDRGGDGRGGGCGDGTMSAPANVLAQLMAQGSAAGADVATLRAIAEEAGALGASRALTRLGLDDADAGKDMEELRELLGAWRDAKRSAVKAVA